MCICCDTSSNLISSQLQLSIGIDSTTCTFPFAFSMELSCHHLQVVHTHFAFGYFRAFYCATCANNFVFWRFVLNVMAITRKHKINDVFLFFKLNQNIHDMSPLIIPPWSISSSKTNSNGSKVESNLDFQCNNPMVQLACPRGLPTFILPTPKLFKIHVILRKGNKYIYDISSKCKEIWATQFPWAKMMKNDIGEIHQIMCIIYSTLGLKFDTFERCRKNKKI